MRNLRLIPRQGMTRVRSGSPRFGYPFVNMIWLKGRGTAIVETVKGRIELMDWPYEARPANPSLPFYNGDMEPVRIAPDSYRFRPLTERLISSIRRTWPSPHDASVKEGWLQISSVRPSLGR